MKALAVLLILIGAVGLAYGGFSYKSQDKVIDVGPIEVTTEKTNRVPLSPVLGGVVMAVGVGMLILGRKH